jgi:WD40 repeat protein
MVEVTRNGQTEETDVASRPRVRTQEKFAGHTAPILRCRFSADGTNVASAAADRTVRVWTPGNQVCGPAKAGGQRARR